MTEESTPRRAPDTTAAATAVAPGDHARSDSALVAETSTRPAAFGELYRRHEPALLAFFLHWTRSAELAADLTAETFAAALSSLATFDPTRGELRGWLFGIARHTLARSLERGRVEDAARRRLEMPRLQVDDEAIARIDAIGEGSLALALLDELAAPIREAVQGRVLDDRDYRELAADLKCSESLVRQRVKRGLARLRKRLEDER